MSSQEETGWMPATIGLQPTILYWEINEVAPVVIMFGFGTFVGHMSLCMVGIVIYFLVMGRYKDNLPAGYAINLMYAAGLKSFKHYPLYIAKDFAE